MSILASIRPPQRRFRRSLAGARAMAALALAMFPLAAANAQVFSNTAPIAIPDVGPANPFPSTINVAGRAEPISGMRVTLTAARTGTGQYTVTFTTPLPRLPPSPSRPSARSPSTSRSSAQPGLR